MAKRAKKNYKKQNTSVVVTAIAAIIIVILSIYFGPEILDDSKSPGVMPDGAVQVHFIDVGQGDSALIVTPGGKYVLVDAGPNSSEKDLLSYLDSHGVEEIEYVVLTHPHEDHIGGADGVINKYIVKHVMMPDVSSDTITFERVLEAIDKHDVDMIVPKPGGEFSVDGVSLRILAPLSSSYRDLNNYSIVMRVSYGSTSVIFTGDAEALSEKEMLKKYSDSDLRSNILKVGHHGSVSSTTLEFLNAVSPEIAVISCGTGNTYGHPHKETIDKLNKAGVNIYRTDMNGSVVFALDGETITEIK